MTKWIVLAFIAGIAGFFYYYDHKSPAYLAYLKFDRARLTGSCGALQPMVDGPAKAWLEGFCAGGSGGDVLAGMAALAYGTADSAYDHASTAGGLSNLHDAGGISMAHKKLSEDEASDGSITLEALCFPVTTKTDRDTLKMLPSTHRHKVVLKPQGEGFVVTRFEDAITKD